MKYEVAVFNKKVRDTIRSGDEYIGFVPLKYENVILHEIYATTIAEATKRAETKWPSHSGYVIEALRFIKH